MGESHVRHVGLALRCNTVGGGPGGGVQVSAICGFEAPDLRAAVNCGRHGVHLAIAIGNCGGSSFVYGHT